jgi:hypothetical protein
VPLLCIKCETPVPAINGETAWVCARCGQGLLLDEEKGLVPLEIRYSNTLNPGIRSRPFWVAEGRVWLNRQTFGKSQSQEALAFWQAPRLFFIPAFTCSLETLLDIAPRLLRTPPVLQPGPPGSFEPITLSPRDVHPLAEYLVMIVEAERKDMLKSVELRLELSTPALWILP